MADELRPIKIIADYNNDNQLDTLWAEVANKIPDKYLGTGLANVKKIIDGKEVNQLTVDSSEVINALNAIQQDVQRKIDAVNNLVNSKVAEINQLINDKMREINDLLQRKIAEINNSTQAAINNINDIVAGLIKSGTAGLTIISGPALPQGFTPEDGKTIWFNTDKKLIGFYRGNQWVWFGAVLL